MISNVAEWLDITAQRFPDKTAVWDEINGNTTFKIFRDKAVSIAAEIIRLNTRHRDAAIYKKPVVIYFEKSVRVLISFMATAYSGNFYSPIDVDMPEMRVRKILDILKPALVITSADLADRFKGFGYDGDFIVYEDIEINPSDEEIVKPVQSSVIDTDILYVLFTSGSTGTPKGVCIPHRAIMDYAECHVDIFKIDENDIIGNQAAFYFDLSCGDIFPMLKSGAKLVIIPKELFAQPGALMKFIIEHKISTIYWVPSALMILSRLKAFKKVDISGVLKKVLFCGEVMQTKQLNIWKEYLPDVLYCNLYGPTEAAVACTYHICSREYSDAESLPIGLPMKNSGILLLDENDRLIDASNTDGIGEICIRGTGLALGYYNDIEKTRAVFTNNPVEACIEEKIYRTGDLAKYNKYGELEYVCRKDSQIKHNGHRIELGEIEAAYSSIDNAPPGCCIYDDKKSRIVIVHEGEVNKDHINAELLKRLPEYMLPNKYISVKKMPFNANGKVDRKSLKELFL